MRRSIVAACALVALLSAAPAAEGAYLERQVRSFDGFSRGAYWEIVPLVPAPAAQDVTYRASLPDGAAARRIEIVDRADPVEADEQDGCVAAAHYGTCVGSTYQAMHVSLWGEARFRDSADSVPIPLDVYINGSAPAHATFASAADIRFDGGDGPDTVVLAGTTAGGASIVTDGGDDSVDSRNGERDLVVCGAGVDTVQADPADDVRADCESVSS